MNPWSAQCVQNTLEVLKGYGHGLREFHQGKTRDTHTCTLVDKSGQAPNVVDTSLCPLPSTLLLFFSPPPSPLILFPSLPSPSFLFPPFPPLSPPLHLSPFLLPILPLQDYVVLEDLTLKFQYPCVLDMKIGTRQHGDDVSEEKRRQHLERCAHSTSQKLGVRICGLQVRVLGLSFIAVTSHDLTGFETCCRQGHK